MITMHVGERCTSHAGSVMTARHDEGRNWMTAVARCRSARRARAPASPWGASVCRPPGSWSTEPFADPRSRDLDPPAGPGIPAGAAGRPCPSASEICTGVARPAATSSSSTRLPADDVVPVEQVSAPVIDEQHAERRARMPPNYARCPFRDANPALPADPRVRLVDMHPRRTSRRPPATGSNDAELFQPHVEMSAMGGSGELLVLAPSELNRIVAEAGLRGSSSRRRPGRCAHRTDRFANGSGNGVTSGADGRA